MKALDEYFQFIYIVKEHSSFIFFSNFIFNLNRETWQGNSHVIVVELKQHLTIMKLLQLQNNQSKQSYQTLCTFYYVTWIAFWNLHCIWIVQKEYQASELGLLAAVQKLWDLAEVWSTYPLGYI